MNFMTRFWINMGLGAMLTVLSAIVKNEVSREILRTVFLQLYQAIKAAYGDDPEFK